MSTLSTSLNGEAGRAAFTAYAEDGVRMRMHKLWERRRAETSRHARIFTRGSRGYPVLITPPLRERWVLTAINGDGADESTLASTEDLMPMSIARHRRITTDAYRDRMILA